MSFMPLAVSSALALSPWEAYRKASTMPNGPWLTRSACNNTEYRGIVFYYSGFSAASSQIEDLAPALSTQCFDVLAPTLPGHGEAAIQNCNAKHVNCTVSFGFEGKTKGFDLSGVPVNSIEYLDFVHQMNGILTGEFSYRANATGKNMTDLSLVSMGLSFGGALAAYAAWSLPLFTHQLLINPFFAYGNGFVDSKYRSIPLARNAEATLMRFGIEGISLASDYVRNSDSILVESLKFVQEVVGETMDNMNIWWGDCPKIFDGGRHGFCAYKTEHVAAASSAGRHILSRLLAENISGITTQAILTERDGLIRNGFTYQFLRHLYDGDVSSAENNTGMCMYRFREGVNRSNDGEYFSSDTCIPHASLDRFDYDKHTDLWWRDRLFGRITSFVTSNSALKEPLEWNGTRDECVGVPLDTSAFLQHPWLSEALLPAAAPLPDKDGDSTSTPTFPELVALLAVNELGPRACDKPSFRDFLEDHGFDCETMVVRVATYGQPLSQVEHFVV